MQDKPKKKPTHSFIKVFSESKRQMEGRIEWIMRIFSIRMKDKYATLKGKKIEETEEFIIFMKATVLSSAIQKSMNDMDKFLVHQLGHREPEEPGESNE